MKFGKFETGGFGVFMMVVAIIGATSIIEKGIDAAVKYRQIKGLEKVASYADNVDSLLAIGEEISDPTVPGEPA